MTGPSPSTSPDGAAGADPCDGTPFGSRRRSSPRSCSSSPSPDPPRPRSSPGRPPSPASGRAGASTSTAGHGPRRPAWRSATAPARPTRRGRSRRTASCRSTTPPPAWTSPARTPPPGGRADLPVQRRRRTRSGGCTPTARSSACSPGCASTSPARHRQRHRGRDVDLQRADEPELDHVAAHRRHHRADGARQPAGQQPDLQTGDVRLERLDRHVGVAFYDIYHDGQLMTSVSGSTLSTSLTVVAGRDLGPVRQRPRRRRQRVAGQHAPCRSPPPQCQADTQAADRTGQPHRPVSGTTVTLRWTASTDNVGRAHLRVRARRHGGRHRDRQRRPPTDVHRQRPRREHHLLATTSSRGTPRATPRPRSTSTSVTTGAACGDRGVRGAPRSAPTPTSRGAWSRCPTARSSTPGATRTTSIRLNPATGAKTTSAPCPTCRAPTARAGCSAWRISPTFASDHWLYLMHTSPTDNRIVRIKLVNNALITSTEQVLLSGIPRNKFHDGGRLRFGPDGKLYAATGDAQNGDNAQNRQQPRRQDPAAQPRRHRARRTTRSATTSGATATATRRASRSTRRAGCGSRSSATPSWTRPT